MNDDNGLRILQNETFGKVRVVMQDGNMNSRVLPMVAQCAFEMD